jgi:putative tricarboxylic transport membrane protein
MLVFGMFGYMMRKAGFPPAPLVLGLILGRMLERTVQQSLIMSGGDYFVFFKRPISAGLLSFAIILILKPVFSWLWNQQRKLQHG